jgi:hypothetical protein
MAAAFGGDVQLQIRQIGNKNTAFADMLKNI